MLTTDATPCLYDMKKLYGDDFQGAMLTYPIWDEAHRGWLNERIFDHFAFRPIAQETPAMFFFFLTRRMTEMMPTINPIFKVLASEVDILSSYRTTDISTGTVGTDTTTQNDTEQKQLYSATPQTQLSGEENYATNLTEATGKDMGTSKVSGTNEDSLTKDGRAEPVSDMTAKWLAGVNNALYIVFNGLEPLFQQVWDE